MTIEEKAKRYDEALERAKDYHKQLLNEDNPEWAGEIENIFPELKDSEDEKIKGAIIDHLKDNNLIEWAAWLEKQGEQAVIPHKFNAGDWIVSKWGGIYQIKEVMSGSYNLLCTNNAEEINSITQVDNNSRLLCIGDIKKLEEQNKKKNVDAESLSKTILASHGDPFEKPKWSDDDEQYLLICKNALRKYQVSDKWDADIISKWLEDKLKQGEQKPKWTEEDECYIGECISAIATKDGWSFEEKRKIKNWLKSLKQRQVESKWIEEDSKMLETLIAIFEVNYPDGFYKVNPIGTTDMQGIHSSEIVKWLRTIKQRMEE